MFESMIFSCVGLPGRVPAPQRWAGLLSQLWLRTVRRMTGPGPKESVLSLRPVLREIIGGTGDERWPSMSGSPRREELVLGKVAAE